MPFWKLLTVPLAAVLLHAAPDPVLVSFHPFVVQRGATATITIRGTNLGQFRSAHLPGAPFTIQPLGEPRSESTGRGKTDLLTIRVAATPEANAGAYPVRLLTSTGITNALPLYIAAESVQAENDGPHNTPKTALPIPQTPAIFTGMLSQRGEMDLYRITAKAGETYTFQVLSGLPQIAAGGSAATIANFDPSLTILEPTGSWLNPDRLKRIAYSDEPAFVFGRSTDVHLTHRFERAGDYFLRVDAFAGQGGPNYSYQLRVTPGVLPEPGSRKAKDWNERGFERALAPTRLNQLAARGVEKQNHPAVESYGGAGTPTLKLPAALEGVIAQPGETHRARFAIDGPRDLAFEIETPHTAPPYFNPILRLLNGDGEEVASNLFAGKGACTGALFKSMQAKTLVPLREAGTYTIEVRDATADYAGPNFRYRVMVRPQIPHVGDVRMDTDRINLYPGEAKTIRVVFDREEDYRGAVAVTVEGLPAGVAALTGADYEPDKDPPSSIGKRERYTARTERTVVVFTAADDAAPQTGVALARVSVRPVANGKLGAPLLAKEIPLMVVEKR